jgi:geranylgeranyl diphosphate synthase type II
MLEDRIDSYIQTAEPKGLYEPMNYIMKQGGKRMRPALTLMAADLFDTDCKVALDAALAVEVFHNFSLVHDDIMDEAPLRRGKPTIHQKWDVNTGILSGDALLIKAYQLFENYDPSTMSALIRLFSTTALQVCEGQQYDVEFEDRASVALEEYIRMIEYKTAVLLGAALQMGAIVAGQDQINQEALYQFGVLLGIAFQIQDDYLDAFGNPETFGKQVGGDILENKKTFLFIKAQELGQPDQKEAINQWYSTNEASDEKVDQVKLLFQNTGAVLATREAIAEYTQRAFDQLDTIQTAPERLEELREFGEYLMNRTV